MKRIQRELFYFQVRHVLREHEAHHRPLREAGSRSQNRRGSRRQRGEFDFCVSQKQCGGTGHPEPEGWLPNQQISSDWLV